jgi:hypothetical protein
LLLGEEKKEGGGLWLVQRIFLEKMAQSCHILNPKKTRGVSHSGLAIYIKKYLKAKRKNYGNSNISPCKNIIFKKSSK